MQPERKEKGKSTIKGAIFEVNITHRVWKLRLSEENGSVISRLEIVFMAIFVDR